jgi:O-acetyl-ADP-ribose deacetylase
MKTEVRDITRPLTEAIIVPANGIGSMQRGAARDVLEVAGLELEVESKLRVAENKQPFEPGSFFVTGPYKLARRGVKRIYHAVTIKYPGGNSSLDSVNRCVRLIFQRAIADGIKSIAVPALGTGQGRLDKSSVARLLVPIARNVCDQIDIRFIDIDKEFVNELGRLLGKE